jgi:hypothetical protein
MAKLNELTKYLAEQKATTEEFNTNNAWGFGGGIGTKYTLPDGSYVKIGTAYFRHNDPVKYITIYNKPHIRMFDEVNTAKTRLMAIACLKQLNT